jgi:hypothetical protein
MIYNRWYDPCPRCGAEVTSFSVDLEREILDNPEAVLSFPSPSCPRTDDPSADCICSVIVNPAPNPMLDVVVYTEHRLTMRPCGDSYLMSRGFPPPELQGWRMYQTETPEPNSLGELMYDWAKLGDDE